MNRSHDEFPDSWRQPPPPRRPVALRKAVYPFRAVAWPLAVLGLGTMVFFSVGIGFVLLVVGVILDRRRWICGQCGNGVEKTSTLCGVCGSALASRIVVPRPAPGSRRARRR